MRLPRRILTISCVSALAVASWSGGGALCSCGGPERPRDASANQAEDAPPVEVTAPSVAAPSVTAPSVIAPATVTTDEAPAARPDFSDPSWTRTPSAEGKYLIVWRPDHAPLPRNEDFALEVWVFVDGQPQQVMQLGVSAWMPEHGHGMLRQVRAEPQPDGSYRVENMLLHMRGQWHLVFDVVEGSLSERAEHVLEL